MLEQAMPETTRSEELMSEKSMSEESMAGRPQSHVVVIGGGWAGWGAAKSLCEAGVAVTLIDGMVDPTGRQPVTTQSGKPFEAGTRGFWRDYPNICLLYTSPSPRDS